MHGNWHAKLPEQFRKDMHMNMMLHMEMENQPYGKVSFAGCFVADLDDQTLHVFDESSIKFHGVQREGTMPRYFSRKQSCPFCRVKICSD